MKKEPTAKLVKEKYKIHKFILSNNTGVDSNINRFFIVATLDEYVKHLRIRVSMGDEFRQSPFEKNRRIIEKWKEFFKVKKMSSIQFEELRSQYTLLREFDDWVIKEEKFANSSVNKYNLVFRAFLRW